MMKSYKVIALSVGGAGNKVFNLGDIVTDKNFIPGRADQLVTLGFLKEINVPTPMNENVNGHASVSPFSNMTYKKLKEELLKRGIDFNPGASKQEMIELLK